MELKNKAKNGLFNTVLSAVCVFVGVGFITGAEIWFYFARFGINSVFGLAVFGILCFVLVMHSFSEEKTHSAGFGRLETKIELVCELFVGSAMISGLMQTSKTLFVSWWWLAFLLAILVLVTLFFIEKKSFVIYNYFVAFFVIFIVISLFLFNNNLRVQNLPEKVPNLSVKNSLLSSLFACNYIFMNIAEIKPVLENFSKKDSQKSRKILSLIFSLVLIFLLIILSFVLLNNNNIVLFEMPFLLFFKQRGGVVLFMFSVGLVMSLLSTALACFFGVKNKLNFTKNDEKFSKVLVIILSLILGQIPFVFFIKIVYPIIAILNFLLFLTKIFLKRKS